MNCDYKAPPGKICPKCHKIHGKVNFSPKQKALNELKDELAKLKKLRIELLKVGKVKIQDGYNTLYIENIKNEHTCTDFHLEGMKPLEVQETIVLSRSFFMNETTSQQYIELTPLEFESLMDPDVLKHLGFKRVGERIEIKIGQIGDLKVVIDEGQ